MQTPQGNVSTKKAPGMQHKRYMRIERIARLDLSGFTEDQIAFSQGITKVRVNQLKRTPEYIAIRTQVATGIVSQADRQMYLDLEQTHSMVKDMVPEALLAVRDAILDKNNPALRLRAAQDLLDREGTLAKVSKTEITSHHEYNFEQHEAVTISLLDALKQTESQRGEDLGVTDFSKAGLDKESQKNFQNALDLINAVVPSTTVN
jgi:hypothetical protein